MLDIDFDRAFKELTHVGTLICTGFILGAIGFVVGRVLTL